MPNVLRNGARMRSRPVLKNYCFEEGGVPREETEYVEVRYPASCPELSSTTTGRTFSKVFGTRTSCMEQFILSRDLMGPCWLELRGLKPNRGTVSWCKFEVGVDRPVNCIKLSQEAARELPTPRVRAVAACHVCVFVCVGFLSPCVFVFVYGCVRVLAPAVRDDAVVEDVRGSTESQA